MKKKISVICYTVSIILVAAFAGKSIYDHTQYSPIQDSAPFSLWLTVNALYFIVPAIAVSVIGFIVKKK